MNVKRSWKVSLIGLALLFIGVLLFGQTQVVACTFTKANEISIDSDVELYTLEEVLVQVKKIDKNADTVVSEEENTKVLKVFFSREREIPEVVELISVGENNFVCRGEDVRYMLMQALNNH